MAEHMLKDRLRERDIDDVKVASAGVSARQGQPPAQQTVSVLRDEGITSVQRHQSQPVSDIDLDEGDLVLTMTRGHKQRLSDCPEGIEVESLKSFAGEDGRIPDPFGQDESVYRELYGDMAPLIDRVADWLEENNT